MNPLFCPRFGAHDFFARLRHTLWFAYLFLQTNVVLASSVEETTVEKCLPQDLAVTLERIADAKLATVIQLPLSQAEMISNANLTADGIVLAGESIHCVPRQFEVELAKHSSIPLPEVVALVRNFSEDLVTDGSLGIRGKSGAYEIHPDTNLLKAYRVAKVTLGNGPITVEKIISLRDDGMSEIPLTTKEGVRWGRSPPRLKSQGDHALVRETIAPEVIQELSRLGYQTRSRGTATEIIYSVSETQIISNLKKYVVRLNEMIALKYPIELITAFAEQELLLIHPFQNGNGRIARLIAQALYFNQSGKAIIFPKSFKTEMGQSSDQLAKEIIATRLKRSEGSTIFKQNEIYSAADISTLVYASSEQLPKRENVAPASSAIFDSQFGKVLYAGKPVLLENLTAKAKKYDGAVFYGKPFATQLQADDYVKTLFQFGRSTRGAAHWDVKLHYISTKKSVSGFFPTTTMAAVAEGFTELESFKLKPGSDGSKRSFGVIFVIDAKGADVLDADEVAAAAPGADNVPYYEGELLFSNTLSPKRIIGAIVIESVRLADDWHLQKTI